MNTHGLVAKSLLILSLTALPACLTVPTGQGDHDAGHVDRGLASWYGGRFHGRPTTSGEIYDQFKVTAAHRLLPLGSVVRVTNAENGLAVVAVINDRGPFIRGRIIDLSYAAARQLGAVESGTVPVLIEVVQRGSRSAPSPSAGLTELEQKDDFQSERRALWFAQNGGFRDGDARSSAVESQAGQVTRGPMDVLRHPRRSRRVAQV